MKTLGSCISCDSKVTYKNDPARELEWVECTECNYTSEISVYVKRVDQINDMEKE